jgi:hypothetical protein
MEVQVWDGLTGLAIVLDNRCAARVEHPLDGGGRQTDHLEHWAAILFGQRVQILNVTLGNHQGVAWSRRLVPADEHREPFILECPRRAVSSPPKAIAELTARHVEV